MANISDREFLTYLAGSVAIVAGFFGFVWAVCFIADVLAK